MNLPDIYECRRYQNTANFSSIIINYLEIFMKCEECLDLMMTVINDPLGLTTVLSMLGSQSDSKHVSLGLN